MARAYTEPMLDSENRRVTQSEHLLAQLYRDDVKGRFVMPDLRAVKLMMVFSFLALILFSGTLFYKFNNFILLREDVYSKASNLESSIQRRTNLFSNLINLTLNHATLEHSVYTATAKMRTEILNKQKVSQKDRAALSKILNETKPHGIGKSKNVLPTDWNEALKALRQSGSMGGSLDSLMAVVEQYPNIQSAQTYSEMMKSLVEMEDRIAERRVEYNHVAQRFNTEISKFPWKLLAYWTDFKRISYFNLTQEKAAPVLTHEI